MEIEKILEEYYTNLHSFSDVYKKCKEELSEEELKNFNVDISKAIEDLISDFQKTVNLILDVLNGKSLLPLSDQEKVLEAFKIEENTKLEDISLSKIKEIIYSAKATEKELEIDYLYSTIEKIINIGLTVTEKVNPKAAAKIRTVFEN